MSYVISEISPKLRMRCQVCVNGGQNIFPDCLDFDPTKSCYYFDDINDDDPRDDDYDCGAYMHVDDYENLKKQIKNK
jgi:hypothetical protein